MDPLQMQLKISNLIDLSSNIVRGMWLKEDLLSDFASNFDPLKIDVIDLKSSVVQEWTKRKEIREKHLQSMIKAREAYENELLQAQLDAGKSKGTKSQSKKDAKSEKKPKAEKKTPKTPKSKVKFEKTPIPPIVEESTYIDVEAEYLHYENSLIETMRQSFAPESLELGKDEVF